MAPKHAPSPEANLARAEISDSLYTEISIAGPDGSNDPYDFAAAFGWKLFKVHGPNANCDQPGKKPLHCGWQKSPGLQPDVARAWLAKGGNLGLLCGEPSGRLLVVDIDETRPEGLPDTPTVITGGGGQHLYYRVPEGVELPRANKVRALPGIDIRYTGGFVVYVGSVHAKNSAVYEWAPGLSPDEIPIAEVPKMIVDAILSATMAPTAAQPSNSQTTGGTNIPYARAALKGACEDIARALPGARNGTLYEKAFKMGGYIATGNLGYLEVFEAILAAAPIASDFPECEVRKALLSGLEGGMGKPLIPPPSTPSPSSNGEGQRFNICVPDHSLTIKDLFRLLPASRNKNPAIAEYHDSITIGVVIREITDTLDEPEAVFEDDRWIPFIENWAKQRGKNPVSVVTSVINHWRNTSEGHTCPFLAASWAWRQKPEAEWTECLRYERWRMTATFCMRLQQVAGPGNSFFLSGEELSAEIQDYFKTQDLGVASFCPRTARNVLTYLVEKGILVVVKKGNQRKANHYSFVETFL